LTSEAGADDDALPDGAAEVVLSPPLLLPHAARASALANSAAAIFKPLYKGNSFFLTPRRHCRAMRLRP
jgi:hypothetical protein